MMFLIHTPGRWATQSELVFADPGSQRSTLSQRAFDSTTSTVRFVRNDAGELGLGLGMVRTSCIARIGPTASRLAQH
jgi:hypothetical protein